MWAQRSVRNDRAHRLRLSFLLNRQRLSLSLNWKLLPSVIPLALQ